MCEECVKKIDKDKEKVKSFSNARDSLETVAFLKELLDVDVEIKGWLIREVTMKPHLSAKIEKNVLDEMKEEIKHNLLSILELCKKMVSSFGEHEGLVAPQINSNPNSPI